MQKFLNGEWKDLHNLTSFPQEIEQILFKYSIIKD